MFLTLLAVDLQLLREYLEMQIVPVSAAVQAYAKDHGDVQRRGNLPGCRRELRRSAKEVHACCGVAWSPPIRQHGHQRALVQGGPDLKRDRGAVLAWVDDSCRDLRVQLPENGRESRAVFGIQDHAHGDIRAESARSSQCVEAADVGSDQEYAPAEIHCVVQFLDAYEAHVETMQIAGQEIHTVKGHAGKSVEVPCNLAPRRGTTKRPSQVGTRGSALGATSRHEIGGYRKQYQPRHAAANAEGDADQKSHRNAAATLGAFEPGVRHVLAARVMFNVPFAIAVS